MFENPTNNFESAPSPKEREVLKQFETLLGEKSYVEVQREEDEEGLKRLVVESVGDDGDPVWHDYVRTSTGGAIDVIYLDSDRNPVGGDSVSVYEGGDWKI